MENVIYNELRIRGYLVDVGVVESRVMRQGKSTYQQYEIDFIATNGINKYYIQSAYALADEEKREQELMWKFYDGVKDIPNVTLYGDFSTKNRCAIVALNIGDYDSAEVRGELRTEYGISTRPGGHCAPLAHEALGNVEQGAVRFSFSHYNTDEEIETAIRAIEELAQDEE